MFASLLSKTHSLIKHPALGITLKISYSKHFIFIHIFKVAGVSIQEALASYIYKLSFGERVTRKSLEKLHLPIPFKWYRYHPHAPAKSVKAVLPPRIYDSFYKFAFVRNPWDWNVSRYHYIQGLPSHYLYKQVRDLSFSEYIELEDKEPRQYELICDEQGNLIIDFVGRFENLTDDFQHVCKIIGVNAHLPHMNKSHHRHYREYYTDRTRQIVKERYQVDIEMFDYEF